jgi:rhodanese-related sulfurtransferase
MSTRVSAQALKAALHDGAELALVDAREQGIYSRGHLLYASCLPLSRIELLAADLIPRHSTRIVVCDGGDDNLAARAAARLGELGYGDVSVLDGGCAGWRAAGYELFSGVNVPSKAFGEYVEQRCATPHLSAAELNGKLAAGEKLVILDSRPLEEFRTMSIPGGIDCPGAELLHRVFDAAPDPETLVVVNCAGRTRSIIGAQSLINAGIPNRVVALKDGTMGWQLAGFEAARGATLHAPEPTAAGSAKAQAAARRVAERFGVRTVDRAQLNAWQAERDTHTLYVLDVRMAQEFAAGHLAGSRHAPGGQLVQATDEFVATRNARIVLVDDTGVRATMTASWLLQMGWRETYVLRDALKQPLHTGAFQPTVLGWRDRPKISAPELSERLDAGTPIAVLDFATSLDYRKQHIPGAYWAMRTRLKQALASVPVGKEFVVTSPDGMLAHFAAGDLLASRSELSVRALEGGTQGWIAAGFPVDSEGQRLTCEPDDIWYKPYQQGAATQAMQDYLTWEVNLIGQIERDGDARWLR